MPYRFVHSLGCVSHDRRKRHSRSIHYLSAFDLLTRATRAFERIKESQNHLVMIRLSFPSHFFLLLLRLLLLHLSSHSSMIHLHRKLYYPGKLNESESELTKQKIRKEKKKKKNKASDPRFRATDLINRFLLFCSGRRVRWPDKCEGQHLSPLYQQNRWL